MAQDAFEDEAKAVGGAARARVAHGAGPFEAAVAEILEDMAQNEVERLGAKSGALQRGV